MSDRAQISSSQQVFGQVETCSEIVVISTDAAFVHCRNCNVAGFFWSSSVWTTVKAQKDKIASWSFQNGGERDGSDEAGLVIGGSGKAT